MGFDGEIALTYEGGVLRPDQRLDLPEGTRLRAVIRPESQNGAAVDAAIKSIRRIRESGVFRSGGRRLTRDEMHERD